MTQGQHPHAAWRAVLWIGAPAYLIANGYLLSLGEFGGVMIRAAYVAYIALLIWLTSRATRPLPAAETERPLDKPRLGAQLAVVGLVILATGLSSTAIPLWSDLVAWLHTLGESLLPAAWFGGPGNAVANPVQYAVIPLILLVSLGAKPGELGLGRGHKVWPVCLIWLALPVVIWAGLLLAGALPAQTLARRIIGNTFQNGFFEEFLFRGALQTRLQRGLPAPWPLILQALVFGLWHLHTNTQSMNGNLLAGLALSLVSQGVMGLAFGYVFQRTRNLIAPSVAHVAMNVLGQTFG